MSDYQSLPPRRISAGSSYSRNPYSFQCSRTRSRCSFGGSASGGYLCLRVASMPIFDDSRRVDSSWRTSAAACEGSSDTAAVQDMMKLPRGSESNNSVPRGSESNNSATVHCRISEEFNSDPIRLASTSVICTVVRPDTVQIYFPPAQL